MRDISVGKFPIAYELLQVVNEISVLLFMQTASSLVQIGIGKF